VSDKNKDHQFDLALEAHVEVADIEAGHCLNRHGGYTVGKPARSKILVYKSSCSHRWQARKQAQGADKGWYNFPAYEKLCKRMWVEVDRKKVHKIKYGEPNWGRRVIKAPKPGDWDVKGDNFMMYSKDPYAHEAHHIIPDSGFNNSIQQLSDEMGDDAARAKELVRKSLLKAKYNLNHKINMMILPQDEMISIVLALPRHSHWPDDKFHEGYTAKVLARVKPVIRQYMKAVAEALEKECNPAPVDLSKAKLERVSKAFRKVLRALGEKKKAHLISRITDAMIRRKFAELDAEG
jgi:hypothetical protein